MDWLPRPPDLENSAERTLLKHKNISNMKLFTSESFPPPIGEACPRGICFDNQPLEEILYPSSEARGAEPADLVRLKASRRWSLQPSQKRILKKIAAHHRLDYDSTQTGVRRGEPNPYTLRAEAKTALECRRFSEAEAIYRYLLRRKFEVPGTLCHLARVQICAGDADKALKSARKAWSLRSKALPYVIPRIIFLHLLLSVLMKKPVSEKKWLRRMRSELSGVTTFEQWDIHDMLLAAHHFFPESLPEEKMTFFSLLGEALHDLNARKTLDNPES